MRKQLLAFSTAAVALLSMASAGASAKTATLTWLCRDWTDEVKWEKVVVEKFMKQHPDIKIKLNIVSQSQYDDKLMVMIATGQAPDLWSHIGSSGFMDYKTRNLILDLTKYVKADRLDTKDFFPRALSIYNIGGKVWGFPTGSYASFTYYNTTLFKQAGISGIPTNWSDKTFDWSRMTEYARKIAKDINSNGKIDGKDTGGVTAAYHFEPELGLAWNWGGDFWPPDTYETGFPRKSTLDTPQVVNAYKAFMDLQTRYNVWGGDFNIGRKGMQVSGSWMFDDLKKVKKVEWDVGVTPAGPAGRVPVLFIDPWVVFKNTKYPKEAYEFLKYITSVEAQKDWISITGKMPSRKSLLPTFLKTIPNVDRADMVNMINGAFEIGREADNHLVVNYRQYDRILVPIFTKIKQSKVSVEQGIKEADAALTKAIAQYANKKKLGSI